MRRYFLILFVIVLASASAYAQSDTTDETADTSCDAQGWYDDIDPDKVIIKSYQAAIETDNRLSARRAAVEAIRDAALTIETSDYPDCVAEPREWYLDGLDKIASALESLIDNEVSDYAIASIQAAQNIGQFRGYLIALGVEPIDLLGFLALK